MMGPDPKILDDIAKVAGGAVNIFSGLQQQIRDEIKSRMDDMAAKMDLVPREDLERAELMITKLRSRVDDLEKRMDALDKGGKKTAAKKAPAKKAPAKKAAAKKKPAAKKKAATQKAKK
ncbi:MAG: accessory factor UbiK family protein [Rhodospirillales bacterium]|nr:accessory factor UbiK family protein [Rhodospirillales bacterium]MCB9995436.1 accessory factor UbiK family protein [Rhodospirillales bacterium]